MFSSGKKLKRKRSASALDINSIVSLLKDKNDRDEERYQAQLDAEKRRDTIMQGCEDAIQAREEAQEKREIEKDARDERMIRFLENYFSQSNN